MGSLMFKKDKIEDNIIKDVRNLLRLKKEIDDNTIKDMRNVFRLKEEIQAIKDRIIRYIRNLFQQEKEDYYKPVRVGNFWSRKYIEYQSNEDRSKTPSIKVYLKKLDHI